MEKVTLQMSGYRCRWAIFVQDTQAPLKMGGCNLIKVRLHKKWIGVTKTVKRDALDKRASLKIGGATILKGELRLARNQL